MNNGRHTQLFLYFQMCSFGFGETLYLQEHSTCFSNHPPAPPELLDQGDREEVLFSRDLLLTPQTCLVENGYVLQAILVCTKDTGLLLRDADSSYNWFSQHFSW